jgi:hypothetical protein
MAKGKRRLLGMDERNLAVVMAEAEFERIVDGLHEHSTEADRSLARETLGRVLREFRAEQKGEVPF